MFIDESELSPFKIRSTAFHDQMDFYSSYNETNILITGTASKIGDKVFELLKVKSNPRKIAILFDSSEQHQLYQFL